MAIPCPDTYVLEVNAHVSLKVASKGYFRDQKSLKHLNFWGYFYKAKLVECNQNYINVSDKFWTFIPCSASYFKTPWNLAFLRLFF